MNRLLRFLDSVREKLHVAAQNLKKQPSPTHAQHNSRIEPHHPDPVIGPILHIPDTVIQQIKSKSPDEKSHEKFKDRLEIGTMGIVFLYTIVAGFQWFELNTQNVNQSAANISSGASADRTLKDTHTLAQAAAEQAKTMRDTLKFEEGRFVAEQRPYIWFVSDKPVIKVGSIMSWNAIAENDGRSPALRMHSCVAMLVRITPDTLPLDERFKNDIPVPSFSKCPVRPKGENRTLSPPGGKTVLTAFDGVLTQENVDYVNGVFGNLVIEAISEYEDSRGNHYLTTFCDIYSPIGLNVQCPYYNEVK